MSVERINSQLKKVREQIAQLQAKEKDLAEQKQMAEDAEAMKIIRKYKISSERLQMLNKLSEDEVRNTAGREPYQPHGAWGNGLYG